MAKSAKEAWKHFKSGSKSIWSIIWGLINFVWLCYLTYQIDGAEKTAELIATQIFIGLLPFLISAIALYAYHYLRSDLYLEQARPQLGKSLIPGRLLKMVEHWKSEPIVGLGNGNTQYNAYRTLLQYRTSYEFDHIHTKIDEFIRAFEVDDNIFIPEIKTTFSTKEEAARAFPRLKQLAKEIGRELT
jgi:predicted nucleic-acid-binding protein